MSTTYRQSPATAVLTAVQAMNYNFSFSYSCCLFTGFILSVTMSHLSSMTGLLVILQMERGGPNQNLFINKKKDIHGLLLTLKIVKIVKKKKNN